MQIYHFICKSCCYESKNLIGSSDMDQILTDVNLEYADYHLFKCIKESKFVNVDIHDNDFQGRCTSDGSELIEIKEMPPAECPRCNQEGLITKTSSPLGQSDT